MSTHGSKRAIIAALLANLGIAIAKFFGFIVTRSSSMLAESIHSVADTGNQVLLLFGTKRGSRAPTTEHPFGYGRERYFWSFVVSIVLFTLGGIFAIYEGIEKILHPHEIDSVAWAIGILGVSIVLEANSFRTAVNESRPYKQNHSWFAFIRRTKTPELPVVLLEDTGALVGLVFALIAVSLSAVTQNSMWDGIGSIVIGSLLCIIAVLLASEMKSLLIGEAASSEDNEQILQALSTAPHVVSVVSLRTLQLGPDEVLVTAKVTFERQLSVEQLAAAVDTAEAAIRQRVPAATRILIEPGQPKSLAGDDKTPA